MSTDGRDDEQPIDEVFRHLTGQWWGQIDHALKKKKEVFGNAAAEAMDFYNGPKDWKQLMVANGGGDNVPDPEFTISVNKTFEFVSIFGPALYYENPVRTVKPRQPVDVPPVFFPDPFTYQTVIQTEQTRVAQDGLKAILLGAYLNWTPHEFNLSEESRTAIHEALIKGRSCIWTELYTPPGAEFSVVKSNHDSVDNLIVDPDASSFASAKWIARRCVHPRWQVERDYGLSPGTIKATDESQATMGSVEIDDDAETARRQGQSNDLVVYWKIWSKMGIGGRLPQALKKYGSALEIFGDYCYMAVAKDVPYFLNLPPHVQRDPDFESNPRSVFARTAWPTPFWAKDTWPVACLDFHKVPNSAWPLPHIKAGMGELRFLNWAVSFLLGHIKVASNTFLALRKSTGEEMKTAILEGKDLTLLEIEQEQPGTINEIVSFLQHPEVNKDIFSIIQMVESNFDKRVGLTELMYGNTEVQLRSAEEAKLKNQNMNVRPADMAKQVETWQAEVATKEAMCARFHLTSNDVAPALGGVGASMWDAYVSTPNAQIAARELEYQIESGSTQKPNKDFEIQQMTEAMQLLLPVFQGVAQTTGNVVPINNLLSDYAKSRDLDPARYQIQNMVPPPMPATPGGGPEGAQQEPTGNPAPGQPSQPGGM